MVKGISKRVVMVKSPPGEMFEQAIFIVKDEALQNGRLSGDTILKEACRVANGYLRRSGPKKFPFDWKLLASAAAGAALTGGVWAFFAFFA